MWTYLKTNEKHLVSRQPSKTLEEVGLLHSGYGNKEGWRLVMALSQGQEWGTKFGEGPTLRAHSAPA